MHLRYKTLTDIIVNVLPFLISLGRERFKSGSSLTEEWAGLYIPKQMGFELCLQAVSDISTDRRDAR